MTNVIDIEYYRKIYNTIIEMLTDREFFVPDSIRSLIIDSVIQINFVVSKQDSLSSLQVFFIDDNKIGINNIKQFITTLQEKNITNAIVVYEHSLTSFAKHFIDSCKDINIEYFLCKELYTNITKHILVPKHVILNTNERKLLLHSIKAHIKNLPIIKKSDPICRYFGAKPGDIFKIYRSNYNITSIYYRICC